MTNESQHDPVWLDEHRALVKARRGWYIANKNDAFLGAALLQYGEALDLEHRFLQKLIGPQDRVIEVGANIGVHTVGMCKAAREVIAIEPQPQVFRQLCANLALNNIQNAVVHNVGCASAPKTMTFAAYDTTKPHNSGGVALSHGAGVRVPVVTLDSLTSHLESVKLVKIDVETMELEVLRGATALIAKHRPLLYVENEMESHCQPLVDWLRKQEYGLFWHTPPLYNPKNLRGAPNGYGGKAILVSYNMLCMPFEWPEVIEGNFIQVTDAFHNNMAYVEQE